MIQRINLIEKQALSFTYEKLIQIFMGVLVVSALLGGVQFLRVKRLDRNIAVTQPLLNKLNAQYTELTRRKQPQRQKKKANAGEYQQLFDTLQQVPPWGKLLRVLANNLPNSVWLTTFKSLGSSIVVPVKKDETTDDASKKKDEDAAKNEPPPPPPPPPSTKVEISGMGMDIKAITEFVLNLEKTPEFTNVSLINTEKSDKGFSYTIQGEVVIDYVR